ncbi:MAG TPA: hypothetical protein VIL34_04550 [Actinopolymorphaceae bacterium]
MAWIPLPEGAADILRMLTFEWPEADEEKLWECGDAWGKFAGQLRDLIERGQKAAQGVLNENSDESIAAFGERWKEFVENPGYLTDAADAAELAQNVFYSASIIVIGLKVFVAVQIVYLIVVWAKAIAAAGPTCGGSLAAAAGVTVGVRAAVHLALKLAIQGLQALGKKVVREALEKVSNLIKRLRHGRKNPPGKKPKRPPRKPGEPDFDNAEFDDRKLTEYALNPNHPKGKHKYRVINSATGLGPDDAQDVKRQILEKVKDGELVKGKVDQYGTRWNVDVPITGPKGTITVRTAWIVDSNGKTRLVTISLP